MLATMYGVGVNDADYNVSKTYKIDNKKVTVRCPYYEKWRGMLKRCYSNKFTEKNTTYKDCYVCDEWLTFSNFKRWMEQQDWEDKELDKDLVVSNNKIYSPETCCFLSKEENSFVKIKGRTSVKNLPIGVDKSGHRKLYQASISIFCKGKGIYQRLGSYETPEEAHRAWQKAKIERAMYFSKLQSDIKIKTGFLRMANKIQEDLNKNIETTTL